MRIRVLSLAVAVVSLIPAATGAQTLNQQGVNRLNQDAQVLWSQDGLPMAREIARAQLQKLVGIAHQVVPGTTATIVGIGAIAVDVGRAPGFSTLRRSRIEARLPLSGTWRVDAQLDVRVQGRAGRFVFDATLPVSVALKNLSAAVRIDVDSTDPSAPRIERVDGPDPVFRVDVDGPPASALVLRWLDRQAIEGLAEALTAAGARQLMEGLDLRITATPEPLGAGAALPEPGPALDLEAAAIALEQQLRTVKMPFGTPLEIQALFPYAGTWEDSLRDPKFVLAVGDYGSSPDSAEHTGLYLGAQAYRYASTRSPAGLAEIGDTLRATRILLTMKGQPGNLNRVLLPKSAMSSPPGKEDYVVDVGGEAYLATDSTSQASYGGILFGLITVHDLVADSKVRDESRQQIEMAVDYLLANNWTWRKRDGSYGERWQGALEQQYAWVLAAARVNPVKYVGVREAYAGLADLLWVRAWTAAMDPYHGPPRQVRMLLAFHLILRLETDPVRWQRVYQGLAIQRRFIGHHQNALFNAIYAAAVPQDRATLGAENSNLLTRLLRQPRRKVVVDITGDPSIKRQVYSPPIDPALEFLNGPPGSPVIIARYPIPVEKRTSAEFAWSASPFRLQVPNYPFNPDPYIEGESLDFLLPYWMSRHYGALSNPTTAK